MYVLEKLWRKGISPNERCCHTGSEYQKLMHRLCEASEKVSAELSPEGKKAFREQEETQLALMEISEEDVFINAFRLGARIMLDVIGDYKGQFREVGEVEQ